MFPNLKDLSHPFISLLHVMVQCDTSSILKPAWITNNQQFCRKSLILVFTKSYIFSLDSFPKIKGKNRLFKIYDIADTLGVGEPFNFRCTSFSRAASTQPPFTVHFKTQQSCNEFPQLAQRNFRVDFPRRMTVLSSDSSDEGPYLPHQDDEWVESLWSRPPFVRTCQVYLSVSDMDETWSK